jgi:cytochrome c oxidase assembly protein Cox11
MLMFCIIGMASAAMPTDNALCSSTGTSRMMNKTEHTFSRTMEVMHEMHKKVAEAPRNTFHKAPGPRDVPGDHAILMFLIAESS